MLEKLAYFKAAAIMLAAALGGCATQPETIVADDAALCQYSTAAAGAPSYAQCRDRLQSQRGRLTASNASRIEGYALLQGAPPSTGVAGDCKTADGAGKCDPADTTGSIPEPKR